MTRSKPPETFPHPYGTGQARPKPAGTCLSGLDDVTRAAHQHQVGAVERGAAVAELLDVIHVDAAAGSALLADGAAFLDHGASEGSPFSGLVEAEKRIGCDAVREGPGLRDDRAELGGLQLRG